MGEIFFAIITASTSNNDGNPKNTILLFTQRIIIENTIERTMRQWKSLYTSVYVTFQIINNWHLAVSDEHNTFNLNHSRFVCIFLNREKNIKKIIFQRQKKASKWIQRCYENVKRSKNERWRLRRKQIICLFFFPMWIAYQWPMVNGHSTNFEWNENSKYTFLIFCSKIPTAWRKRVDQNSLQRNLQNRKFDHQVLDQNWILPSTFALHNTNLSIF